jgi:hypothetical protein
VYLLVCFELILWNIYTTRGWAREPARAGSRAYTEPSRAWLGSARFQPYPRPTMPRHLSSAPSPRPLSPHVAATGYPRPQHRHLLPRSCPPLVAPPPPVSSPSWPRRLPATAVFVHVTPPPALHLSLLGSTALWKPTWPDVLAAPWMPHPTSCSTTVEHQHPLPLGETESRASSGRGRDPEARCGAPGRGVDYSPLRFSFGVPWLADIVMCVSGGCSGESKGDGSDGGHRP